VTERQQRLERWSERTEGPLFALALIYLVAWSFIVLAPNDDWNLGLFLVMLVIWALFGADYVVKVVLAERHGLYIFHHLPDLLAVFLPFLRPAVQLTHIHSIPFFRRRTGAAQRTRIVILAAAFAVLFVYSMALAVFTVERDAPDTQMATFGDSIWWACVTLFTVGYGDIVPVTSLGRVYAVMLMLGGILIIGVASATIVSYLNERIRDRSDPEDES
jgi:voltage-gated potassium channel